MTAWIFSFLFSAMEILGSFYFLNTFLEQTFLQKREGKGSGLYKFFSYFILSYLASITGVWIGLLKCVPVIMVYVFLNGIYYRVSLKQNLLFSIINYTVILLVDYVILWVWILISPESGYSAVGKEYLSALIAKTLWIVVLLFIRKYGRQKTASDLFTGAEWIQLVSIPLFTMAALLIMYFFELNTGKAAGVFLFLSAGFVGINFIIINLMQNIMEKEEKIRLGMLAEQSQRNRLEAYQDREEIYERQRRKMHDYKNQLRTIQSLLAAQDIQSAASFLEKLTESISVDMSAVNTNHPIVNAVLNQKYRSMQEKNIAVIFKVGDLHEIRMEEEDIVVLLSNLLDNAIRESEKVLKERGKAVIHLKLVYEEYKIILSVRNPVMEKVEIRNNAVWKNQDERQGIGLLNVRAVVDKYDGDMVLSCTDSEFKVVVIL